MHDRLQYGPTHGPCCTVNSQQSYSLGSSNQANATTVHASCTGDQSLAEVLLQEGQVQLFIERESIQQCHDTLFCLFSDCIIGFRPCPAGLTSICSLGDQGRLGVL